MTNGLRQSAYDVVIIGSGHNGLIAAAYLASSGLSVAVLERNLEFGGATVSQRVFPEFDARLSRYSYLVSLLPQAIIDELQLNFATRRRRVASCTPYQTVSGDIDALVISNVDTDTSRSSMRQLCGSDTEWQGYCNWQAMLRGLAARIWPSLLEPLQSRAAFKSQLDREQLRAWEAVVERPLGESLESFVSSDLVRGLLLTDAKIGVFTHAHDSSLLQNRCFLYHVVGQGTGEWQVPIGGMQSLTDSLLQRCRALGVELLSGASAERLTTAQVHALEFTHGDRVEAVDARYVLINAGASTFARLSNQSWSPTANDEGSVVKVNMLLKRLPQLKAVNVSSQDAFAGSFHVSEGYQQMQRSYEQASAGEIPTHPPFEIYCHTLTDPSILSPQLQTQGFHTLTLFGLDMPYRLFVEDAQRKREIVLNRYLDALDQLCQGSFRQCLASDSRGEPCIEIKLPQDLEHELGLDLGNIFHTAPSWFFAEGVHAEGSWGVETAIDRVYCAGSSAQRGGAVSGIPGRNAAMAVLARERQ